MKRIITLLCILSLISAKGLLSQENKIIGTWLNEEATSHIRIFKATNGNYYGKIEWLKTEPERLDVHNPNPEKQKQPLMGLLILRGFSYNTDEAQWENGTIYDPKVGKTYDCYMWFDGNDDQLYIKGYVLGMRFIGRETTWKRVKP